PPNLGKRNAPVVEQGLRLLGVVAPERRKPSPCPLEGGACFAVPTSDAIRLGEIHQLTELEGLRLKGRLFQQSLRRLDARDRFHRGAALASHFATARQTKNSVERKLRLGRQFVQSLLDQLLRPWQVASVSERGRQSTGRFRANRVVGQLARKIVGLGQNAARVVVLVERQGVPADRNEQLRPVHPG